MEGDHLADIRARASGESDHIFFWSIQLAQRDRVVLLAEVDRLRAELAKSVPERNCQCSICGNLHHGGAHSSG